VASPTAGCSRIRRAARSSCGACPGPRRESVAGSGRRSRASRGRSRSRCPSCAPAAHRRSRLSGRRRVSGGRDAPRGPAGRGVGWHRGGTAGGSFGTARPARVVCAASAWPRPTCGETRASGSRKPAAPPEFPVASRPAAGPGLRLVYSASRTHGRRFAGRPPVVRRATLRGSAACVLAVRPARSPPPRPPGRAELLGCALAVRSASRRASRLPPSAPFSRRAPPPPPRSPGGAELLGCAWPRPSAPTADPGSPGALPAGRRFACPAHPRASPARPPLPVPPRAGGPTSQFAPLPVDTQMVILPSFFGL
jgi:hypothetical protein